MARRRDVLPILLVLAASTAAAAFAGSPAPERPVRLVRAVTGTAPELELRLDEAAVGRLKGMDRALVTGFPLPGRGTVDLSLRSFEILSPTARIVSVGVDGERETPRPGLRFFRGRVPGAPDSLVALTLVDDRIAGFVRMAGETFDIGPGSAAARAPGRVTRIRNVRDDASTPDPLPCGAEWQPFPPTTTRPELGGVIGPGTVLKASIAVDATVEWYDTFGSLSAAQSHILSVLAEVSTIFETEFNVQLEVSYLRVFTAEPDPYPNGETSSSDLMDDFRTEWNQNQTGVSRTVAHLFSVKSSGGNGYAYIDVLCSNDEVPGSSYDYGVTILDPGASFETWLVAHELGHNFGSPHTHCYVPEIDRCATESGCYQGSTQQITGTIMSYCNATINEFHQRAEDERLRPAVEAAFPTCVELAGGPTEVPADATSGLILSLPAACPAETLRNDDGAFNNVWSMSGTIQGAFIKRFTPGCYPFRLDRIDFLPGASSSIAAGRPIRLLVYSDPSGSGDPAQATLIYSEDTFLQTPSYTIFNEHPLTAPATVSSGDLYLGYYDLLADATNTVMAVRDSSVEGDSWRAANSTAPDSYLAVTGGTWMIRGHGGPVGAGSVRLNWGEPCNLASVPGQDYAVYQGTIGNFASHVSLTCSTAHQPSFVAADPPDDSYFLVVPLTGTKEGSYGRDHAGAERPAAAAACKVQQIDACP